jgi:hypothetical protein
LLWSKLSFIDVDEAEESMAAVCVIAQLREA